MEEKRWYVVYTMFRHEKKVAISLHNRGIESFLPVQEEIHQWHDRKKKVERVVIPTMVFVFVTPKERLEVLKTPSVIRFMVMRGEHTPAVIPTPQIERFKYMLGYSDKPVTYYENNISVGEKVRVIRGNLIGMEGVLIKIDKKSKFLIDLELLGSMGVEIDSSDVELIGG